MNRRRLVRVPASSANLGPGFDALAAALALHLELEVEETGDVRRRDRRSTSPATGRNLVRAGLRAPAPGRRLHLPHPLPDPAGRRAGLERRGDGGRADGRRPPVRARRRPARGPRPSWRAIPTTPPPRCWAASSSAPTARPRASTSRPGWRPSSSCPPREPVRTEDARAALPAEVPMADAVFNVAHASLLVLGLAKGEWDLVARGLHDRLHQPRRAHLYPRSMELAERAHGARRAGRHDLRRRPDRALLDPLRADRRRRRGAAPRRAGRRRPAACPSSRRAPRSASSRRATP